MKKSIQKIKTIKRLLQHNNKQSVLTANVSTKSLLTGHFDKKAKTKQFFLIHPGTKPQCTCYNENDLETTQPFIQNSSINIIK